MRFTAVLLLIVPLCCSGSAAQSTPEPAKTAAPKVEIHYTPVPETTIAARLATAKPQNAEREAQIKALFSTVGCSTSEQFVHNFPQPNVVCVLPGQSDHVILVGAHFDKVDAGEGVVDNWSGSSLLPTLYETLRARPLHHTIVFVAFAGEEKGLLGSKQYLASLHESALHNLSAMVNLDTLGLSPTKIWASHGYPVLVNSLNTVATAMHLPVEVMNVDNVGTSDSEPFREHKVPSITVHSVTTETLPILHSPKDTPAAIHMGDYYATYKLLSGYLLYLDQTLDIPTKAATAQP